MADERVRFLAAFFWVVVAFFGYAAAKAHVEANWPMMAFVSGLILVAGDWTRYTPAWRKAGLIVLFVTDLAAVTALSLLLVVGKPLLSRLDAPPVMTWVAGVTGSDTLATGTQRSLAELQAKLSEIIGPREVAQRVELEFRSSGADFLCADTYQTFGILSFYAPGLEPLLWLPIRGRARFPWIDEREFAGKRGLTVEWPRSGCNYGWLFQKTLWTKKICLPGIARPVTLTMNEGYDPARIREE